MTLSVETDSYPCNGCGPCTGIPERFHSFSRLGKRGKLVSGTSSVSVPNPVCNHGYLLLPLLQPSVLRFKSFNPPATIYTADFTITNMTGDRAAHLLRESLSNSGALTSLSTSVSTSSSSMPDGGNNDLVTVTREMSDSNSASSPDPTSVGAVAAMANSASNGGRHVRRPNIQFNFVFVLLPSLFGLALAL